MDADKLILNAQCHAMEARTQRATVHEIYQIIGSKKGDWNGAQPVKQFVDEIKNALEECHQAFRDRKHGGVAEQKLRHDLEQILDMPYEG